VVRKRPENIKKGKEEEQGKRNKYIFLKIKYIFSYLGCLGREKC
jgi:hypothetical protein